MDDDLSLNRFTFYAATLGEDAFDAKRIAAMLKITQDQAEALVLRNKRLRIFVSDTYEVRVGSEHSTPMGFAITHLSIKRRDREPMMHDWRELQRIKNALLGPEREAVELYPAESRLVDTANQYHLWALPVGAQFPFGFTDRLVHHESTVSQAKQRRISAATT